MNMTQSTKPSLSGRVQDERGVALFLALILLSTLSVLTVSMMFLAQSESMSSGNYRLMTQARYGAEAGVQRAADFIAHNYNPAPLGGAFMTAYQAAPVSPVQFNNAPIVLSSDPNHNSNYPDAATIALFQGATQGQVVAGNSTINFTAYATLISMDQLNDAYTGLTKIVQTWQVTSDATINGIRKSTVEVSAIIDAPKTSALSFAAFATSRTCNALYFWGDVRTNSYNSNDPDYHPFITDPNTGMVIPNPTYSPPQYCPSGPQSGPGCMENTGGDVATNGNLEIIGHVNVDGNLSSPITGVGACVNNNGVASTALTESGLATVQGGAPLQLPYSIKLPTPKTPPTTTLPPALLSAATLPIFCASLPFPAGTCTRSGNVITLSAPPGFTIPPLTISDQASLVLTATAGPANLATSAEYDFSSITLLAQSSLAVSTDAPTHTVPVYLTGEAAGGLPTPTVLDFQGGASASDATFGAVQGCQLCSSYDASILGFFYGGTGTINMVGNSSAAATVYAPNATAVYGGTSDLYGSIIASTLTINGGGGGPNGISINYDQSLSGTGVTAGAPMMSTFSWKKY
jgi:PilX N-terminal